jgi:hypothetical protein
MKTPDTFSVLRYVHDPVTAEFVNIGVALYAPEARYLNALCTSRYQRLSNMFEPVDGDHFRQITRFVQSRIEVFVSTSRTCEHLLAHSQTVQNQDCFEKPKEARS